MAVGLFLFVPASILISYPVFLFALFVVGSGLALLQVAINPYVGALGRPETAATRISICGGLNSLATTIAPGVGAAFIFIAAGATTAQLARSVQVPYIYLAVFTLVLALYTYLVQLPEVIERPAGGEHVEGSAWSFTHLRLGSLAIFTYVGAEVAIGSVLINFLAQPSMGSMSHLAAAHYVQLYWGCAMVGRFIGSAALPFIRTDKALAAVAACAFVLVTVTIFGHGHLALWAIVSCGLFNSVMWPCIFPLSVKGLGKLTNQGSGILVTMIVGGAIIPELQALLADHFGFQPSFLIVAACYAYLLYFGLSGYKLRQPSLDSSPTLPAPVEAV
jgi:FHS family L-fucose permease-like MFS transporter